MARHTVSGTVIRAAALILGRAGYRPEQITDLLHVTAITPLPLDALTAPLLDEAAAYLRRVGFTYPGVATAAAALRTSAAPAPPGTDVPLFDL